MFQGNRPLFKENMILKAEYLSAGMNYPEEMLSALFLEYSDGILSGAEVSVTREALIVNPGIVKFRGVFYSMKHKQRIPYIAQGKAQYVRIRFHEEQVKKEQIIRNSDILLTDNEEILVSDIELGRFKLKEGALLRQDYQDFSDFYTEHNTFQVIYATYAEKGGTTLSPRITQFFGMELLKVSEEPFDLCFAIECMKGEALNRKMMKAYISKRLAMEGVTNDYKLDQNLEIYQCLERILKLARNHNKKQTITRTGRKIFVD